MTSSDCPLAKKSSERRSQGLVELSTISHGSTKKGTTGFTRAIKLEPEEAIFYQHRGWAYELSKTYLEALTDLSRAIDLAPEEARLYDGRGRVHAKLHEYGQAVADYTHAIELDANYNGAYFD